MMANLLLQGERVDVLQTKGESAGHKLPEGWARLRHDEGEDGEELLNNSVPCAAPLHNCLGASMLLSSISIFLST